MSYRIDVVIPALLVSLTYECNEDLPVGAPVAVQVVKKLYIGFVLGPSQKIFPDTVKIKPIMRIIAREPVIPPDLWDLAEWSGREGLCNMAVALNSILPRDFIDGKDLPKAGFSEQSGEFREHTFYYPYDHERKEFYLTELRKDERTLILFPTKEAAQKFFKNLPQDIASEALLWPSTGGKKLVDSWYDAFTQQRRIIVGSQGAVFAPLSPQKIIIEDEANPAYIFQRSPRISARDMARRRAEFFGARLMLCGTMPSLSTFSRVTPKESSLIPVRDNIVLTDINYSREEEAIGVDGNIPITFSLMKRTYRELAKGNNVIWILNRIGNSSEVYCENCGQSLKCDKCGGVLRSERAGEILRCKVCNKVQELPEKCPNCGYEFFKGKRPGVEALYEIAQKYYKKVYLYCKFSDENFYSNVSGSVSGGLVLATQRGLELCDKINPSLVAWLDLDSELWRPDYDTQYKVFRMLWESYWRGRSERSERKVLVQARRSGMKLAEYLPRGWTKFLTHELESREEFMLPPYAYMIEIYTATTKLRDSVMDIFMQADFLVMDPGDIKLPLQISVDSLENVQKILETNATLQKAIKKQDIKFTVRRE